ncbi:MAG: class II aldolase/adducin family protein [Candidatus Tectimicrobiota bacterium]
MSSTAELLRRDLVGVCQRLYQRGFIAGTEGNVSALEAPDRLWITPSGVHKGLLQPAELLLIDLQGRVLFGVGKPSSETPMHLALYRARPEVRAVVHAHPPIATSLTVAGCRLEPPLLPEAVVALGEVPTVPYQMPTTWQFANAVGAAMRHADAALLENHGSVAVGRSLSEAFNRMEIVERAAQILYLARLLGQVQPLPAEAVTALQALRQGA